MVNNIVLLGSTGSIGTQCLEVCRLHNIKPLVLTANNNAELLERQAREFLPHTVCIGEQHYSDLKQRLSDTDIKVISGLEGMCEVAQSETDLVVNSVVGRVGLKPTISALTSGNRLALANKETLVTGGELVTGLAKSKGIDIIPIDSEHSAIFQSLMGNKQNKISKILLTASGGPFYGYTSEQLKNVTVEMALHHPNWSMGKKITVDSATLMNKGLELIEAVWLFDVLPDDIEILIHRQSVLHSAVEYEDGSVIGQLGVPDMKIPIQLALTYPERLNSPAERLSLTDIGTLTFTKPDYDVFLCLNAAKKSIKRGGTAPAVMNSANETAVRLFLDRKIPFYRIPELICECCDSIKSHKEVTLENILDSENTAEEFVLSHYRTKHA